MQIGDPPWIAWRTASSDAPPLLDDATDAWKTRQTEERDRLLYVAMTRARCWLIACCAGKTGEAPGDSWHATIEGGLRNLDAGAIDTPTGPGLRFEHGDWSAGALSAGSAIAAPGTTALPGWTATPPPEILRPTPPIAPTSLGGAKALPGDTGLDPEAAMRRGRHLHLLLEHLPSLPEASWAELGRGILDLDEDPPNEETANEILGDAIRVLTDPALSEIFDPSGLSEVEVTADLPQFGTRLRGIIDRLVIRDTEVLAVDFKSNAVLPDRVEAVPEGLLRQMGAYATALEQIYPDRRVTTAILWTARPVLMHLPHALVRNAFNNAELRSEQVSGS